MKWPAPSSDRGFVLINALLIVAALSALAVQSLGDATMRQGEILAAQTGGEIAAIADAGVAYASGLLADDFEGEAFDHTGEVWAIRNRPVDIGRGTVLVTIEDVQSRLNANALRRIAEAPRTEMVQRLADTQSAPPAAWFALLAHYEGLAAAPDAPKDEEAPEWFETGDLTHAADLVWVPGMSPDQARALAPALSVLPQGHGLNVNTADGDTLAAIAGLGQGAVDAVLIKRRDSPFREISEFTDFLKEQSPDVPDDLSSGSLLAVSSSWFDVRTETVLDDLRVVHVTRLYRNPDDGSIMRYYRTRIAP